jgi:hypothetical protein
VGQPLYSDVRTEASGQRWYLELQAGGNSGGSGSTLGWDPDALVAIADEPWVLYEGIGTNGPVAVADMREASSHAVPGDATVLLTIAVGTVSAAGDAGVPTAFALAGNYPNPFNPMTTIRFDVPRTGRVTVDVYDVRGQRIARLVDGEVAPGRHTVVWDGRDRHGRTVSSGVYFSRLEAEGVTKTDRMVLMK